MSWNDTRVFNDTQSHNASHGLPIAGCTDPGAAGWMQTPSDMDKMSKNFASGVDTVVWATVLGTVSFVIFYDVTHSHAKTKGAITIWNLFMWGCDLALKICLIKYSNQEVDVGPLVQLALVPAVKLLLIGATVWKFWIEAKKAEWHSWLIRHTKSIWGFLCRCAWLFWVGVVEGGCFAVRIVCGVFGYSRAIISLARDFAVADAV